MSWKDMKNWSSMFPPLPEEDKLEKYVPFNPGFPVYIYQEGLELPKDGTYFVVAGNGCFLHKDTGIVSCFVLVDKISILQEIKSDTWVQCKLPPIPPCFTYRVKKFFAQVVEEFRTEANVIVYFNKQTNEYRVFPSEQNVSHGGVNYKRQGVTAMENMDGFLRVGTIHSHCDFGAFHSGVDVGDESDFDGLHITFGHNNVDEFDISASFVSNNKRLKVDPMTVLSGIEPVGARYKLIATEQQEEWLKGMDVWMSTIENPKNYGVKFRLSAKKGDKVFWADPSKVEKWRSMFGDGPFEVEMNEGDKIVIQTPVGLVRFSQKVFKCDTKSQKDLEVEQLLKDMDTTPQKPESIQNTVKPPLSQKEENREPS
jgi:hypothetical protein